MSDYDDRQRLGPMDRIEALSLKESRTDDAGAIGPAVFPCPSEKIAEVLTLWREMPAAEQGRCHVPPYGLRFYHEGALLLSASLCWQCNNIHMTRGGKAYYSTFDARHETSRRLLQLLAEITLRP